MKLDCGANFEFEFACYTFHLPSAMKSIDAASLLFQQDGTSTASLSRVSCASWDPVYADCVGLCDEHGRFQYVDCSTSTTQEHFYHLLALSHDHRVP
jgi:hypothetical protein